VFTRRGAGNTASRHIFQSKGLAEEDAGGDAQGAAGMRGRRARWCPMARGHFLGLRTASSPAPHGLEVALWRAPLRELAFPENPIQVARVDLGSGMADDVGEGFRGEVAARKADATRAFPAGGKEI